LGFGFTAAGFGAAGFFAATFGLLFAAALGLAFAFTAAGDFAVPVGTTPSVAVAAAPLAAWAGSRFAARGPALAVAPRPDGFTAALALAFGLRRVVADFGAAGVPGFGAPTASGEGLVSGGGTGVSDSSRRRRPASSAPAPTALRPRSAAESISFFGSDGIRPSLP
jgi:hypothetical protein